MPEEPDRLEVLTRVWSEVEANLIVQSLEDRNIAAKAVGGFTAGFRAEAPGDVSVLVRQGDLARAKIALAAVRQEHLLEQATDEEQDEDKSAHRAQSGSTADVTFACEECGQSITLPGQRRGHVETCPHCGSFVDVPDDTDGLPPAESKTTARQGGSREAEQPKPAERTNAQLWIEVLAVLCLAYVPALFGAIDDVQGWFVWVNPYAYVVNMIIWSAQVAMPVLVIMALSRDPWRSFGIVRPRWIADTLGGCAIWGVATVAWLLVMSLLPPSMLESSASADIADRVAAEGLARFLLLLIPFMAGAFAEELVMRGYLIPRLERLLRSTLAAVVVTTALFASYHLYQGPAGVITSATTGLVYAVSFCLFRRLWPVFVAHVVWNMLTI